MTSKLGIRAGLAAAMAAVTAVACVASPDTTADRRRPRPTTTVPTTTTSTSTTSTTTSTVPTTPPPVDPGVGRFAIVATAWTDVWVDPVRGTDAATGADAAHALATPAEAWRRIPASVTLTRGVRILLQPGTYPASALPNYMEHRWGTATAPIMFTAAAGAGTALLTGDLNVYDTRHLYLDGLRIQRDGDTLHCERCSYLLVRRSTLNGGIGAQETVKVNQSDHVYLEDSDISGAGDNAIDFVAVAGGHLLANVIHDAEDWCAYVKGGSSGIRVEANEIHHCGTGGFTSGQGTGFEFMVAPWLQYEAYGITATDNVIHDTDGAGMGVNGGYDITYAYNTMYRVGARSHAVEFVQGGRGCDGDATTCTTHHDLGGWGSATASGQWIPNRHVTFADNIVWNPAGYSSRWSHFDVHGAADAPAGSNVASPARADDDLRIQGNVIWNGPADLDIGFTGCQASNPTCNETKVRAENAINTVEPRLSDPAHGVWTQAPGSPARSIAGVGVPAWSWTDAPSGVPAVATPSFPTDRAGTPRVGPGHPGAYEP